MRVMRKALSDRCELGDSAGLVAQPCRETSNNPPLPPPLHIYLSPRCLSLSLSSKYPSPHYYTFTFFTHEVLTNEVLT